MYLSVVLHCCKGFSLVEAFRHWLLLVSVCGLLIALASLVAERGLQGVLTLWWSTDCRLCGL